LALDFGGMGVDMKDPLGDTMAMSSSGCVDIEGIRVSDKGIQQQRADDGSKEGEEPVRRALSCAL
jgi:hypothetical protein